MPRRCALLLIALLPLSGCSLLPFGKPWIALGYDHNPPPLSHTYSFAIVRMSRAEYNAPVQAAITKELGKKGWQPVGSGGAATVFVLGDVQSAQFLADFYNQYGNGWAAPAWSGQGLGEGWRKSAYGEVDQVALGNPGNKLVVDLFDTANHQLLARGVAQNDLSDTPKKNVKLLDGTVHRLLKGLPKER